MLASKFLLLIVSFVFISTISCTKEEEKPKVKIVEKVDENSVKINETKNIMIETVEEKNFAVELEFNGRITVPEKDISSVSARVTGRIESLTQSVGDRVTKGQVLGYLWSADLASASEEYEIAKKEGGSLLSLTEKKLRSLGVEPSEVSNGKTIFAIRSPLTGVILDKKLNTGSTVNVGDIILTVGKIGTLQFVGDFPPEQAIKVRKGMKVAFDDVPTLTATIENVSPISDPTTHLVKIRASFETQPGQEIPQESFLKAHIVLSELPALVFPIKSIIAKSDGEYAFISDSTDSKIFKRVKIDITSRNSKQVAVNSASFSKKSFKVISDGALLINDSLEEGEKD